MVDISTGRKIRSPSLVKGNVYIARIWGKKPTYTPVTFTGFFANGVAHDKPARMLKDMLKTDIYRFVSVNDEVFEASVVDDCLVHKVLNTRLTFSMPPEGFDLSAYVENLAKEKMEADTAAAAEVEQEQAPTAEDDKPVEEPTEPEVVEIEEPNPNPAEELADNENEPVFVETLPESDQEHADESATDRKRRRDAERKRDQRAAARNAVTNETEAPSEPI